MLSESWSNREYLTLPEVSAILAVSPAQVRALVKSQQLRSVQIGGRRVYRVAVVDLETYLQAAYAETDRRLTNQRKPQVGIKNTGDV